MNRKKIAIILFIVMILSELFAGIVFLLPISGFFMYPFISGFAVIMGILSAVLAKDLIVLRVLAIVAVVFLCAYNWSGFDDGIGIYGCDILVIK
ncbi:MAG: hypothetical protein ACLUTF_08495 [Anaerostipes hadrus]